VTRVDDCRLIVDPPAPGAWNMAVDEALFVDAAENGVATLRLYEWHEPTLSLGYFQRYEDRHQHAASRDAAVVRRQSGGGAILHHRELTYSLALPATHPLARYAERLYTAAHEAVTTVLVRHIATTAPDWALRLRCDESSSQTGDVPFLCFQRRARGDVLLVAPRAHDRPPASWKILGSAQRRRAGAILQHGSLLLERSAAAPELAGLNDLTGTSLTAADLAAELPQQLGAALQMRLQQSRLPDGLRLLAAAIETRKYGVPGWTKRR
jgi:lipoate-protein ligase A